MFNLTTKIRGFVLTRDSWLWFWGKLVGFAGIIVAGGFDLKAIGLSDRQQHLAMGVAAGIVGLSAQMATSALPSKADADKVTTHAL